MQSRDLVETHRLVFSAKLYDHQGPIARGGGSYQPPPLTVRVMRNALTGRGLITPHIIMELPTYYIGVHLLWSYLHIHTFIYYYIHFKTSRASIITFASWNPILYFALSNLHRLIVHSQVSANEVQKYTTITPHISIVRYIPTSILLIM